MNFLGWWPHALAAHINPLQNTLIAFPRGVNMLWETSIPLPALLAAPVTETLGPIAAYNVVLVAALALDGYCTFLWLQRRVRWFAALTGGVLFMLGPFVAARAVSHLNFVMVFGLPLGAIFMEELLAGRRPSLNAALLGLVVAASWLSCEEATAIGVIGALVAVAWAAFEVRGELRLRGARLLRPAAVGGLVVLALLAFPLAYQMLGPLRPLGYIQDPNDWRINPLNFFVPTRLLAIHPGSLMGIANTFPGGSGSVEADAYLGLPAIAVMLLAAIRHRRDRTVRTVLAVGVVGVILSLGGYLALGHGGAHIPLPGALLQRIPLVNDILPSRFPLLVDLVAVYLIAFETDDLVASVRGWRWGEVTLVGSAVVTLLPAPITTSTAVVPEYFVNQQATGHLLVLPFLGNDPLLWQAVGGFKASVLEAKVPQTAAGGTPQLVVPGPVFDSFGGIEQGNPVPPVTSELRDAILSELRTDQVDAIVLGPGPNEAALRSFTTSLLGDPGQAIGGVTVWQVPPAAG